jgi:hypothetical protein
VLSKGFLILISMAKKRYINTKFWDDNYIIDLDPIEKLLFLYFLTNPLTDICGIYEIPTKRMAFDTGIDKEMILKIINRFSKDKRIFYIDGWIYIKNFAKHQAVNPKIEEGIKRSLGVIPGEILAKIKEYGIDYDRLCIDYELLKLKLKLKPKPKLKLTPTEGEQSSPPPLASEANTLLQFFFDRFTILTGGDKPVITTWAKHNKNAQRYIKTIGLKEMTRKVDLYFYSEDPFFKKNNYSLDVFLTDNTIHKLK